jgi:hypothetical protein
MSADHGPEGDELIASLARLPQERPAPARLEVDTIGALRARGLLRSREGGWRIRAAFVAAALVIFAAGWALGSRAMQPAANSYRYMLLLYAGDVNNAADDASVQEYRDWARRLRDAGLRISGERLEDAPAAVFGAGGAPGPDRLRGYFVFDATNDRDAMEIARQHPHVRRGGIVILHRIRPT